MNNHRIAIFLFVVSFAIRLVTILNLPDVLQHNLPKGDTREYNQLAMNIIAGEGYKVYGDFHRREVYSYRPPVYPLFLAGIYSVTGYNLFATRFVQAVLHSLMCVIIFLIGRDMFGRAVGCLAGFMSAVYKPFVLHLYYGGPAFLISENLFILFLAVTLLLLNRMNIYPDRIIYPVSAGLCLGITTLTKPITVLMPAFILVWLRFVSGMGWKEILKKWSVIMIFFLITFIPWWVRNYSVQGEFIPLTTQGGVAFWIGNNKAASGGPGIILPDDFDEERLRHMSENEIQRWYFRKGTDALFGDPGRVPFLFIKKMMIFWMMFDEGGVYNPWYGFILLFAFMGIVVGRKIKHTWSLIGLFLYFTLIAVMSLGDPRYRYPIEPYLILLASAGLVSLWRRFHSRIIPISIIGSGLAGNAVLYAFSADIWRWVSGIF